MGRYADAGVCVQLQARRTEEYHSVQHFAGIMAVGGRGTAYDRADATGYAGCY